ncbi:MAG: hypothetical protein WCK41_10345 [Actinomycetes bacterium]
MSDQSTGKAMSADEIKAEANRLIAYHSPISRELTAQRTSYTSQLIPVTAYILVGCCEAFLRYPELMRRIDAAMPVEDIVRAGTMPGTEINSVHLWSIANFWLTGRKVMTAMDPSLDDPEAALTVLDFWQRAASAYRGDGTLQAWDTGSCRPFGDDVIKSLLAGVTPVSDPDERLRVTRFNATLINHLFLLWFDTRSGIADTGPYPLPDGRVLLVREFTKLAESDFWWSGVAADIPYRSLTAAMVLDDVEIQATDFGSINTTPEDYLDRLVGFGIFTTDSADGALVPVPLAEIDELVKIVRRVQANHYRTIAAMSRDEMIKCGAYVYFSFLRPFAVIAGIADELDWDVPRDVPEPLVQLLSSVNGEDVPFDAEAEYYLPLA